MFVRIIVFVVAFIVSSTSFSQETFEIKTQISIDNSLKGQFHSEGRLLLFISEQASPEPRQQTWPRYQNYIYAINMVSWDGSTYTFKEEESLSRSMPMMLDQFPAGKYYVQAMYDQDTISSEIDAEGNLYSFMKEVDLTEDMTLNLILTESIAAEKPESTQWIKYITMKSDTLSTWWGHTMEVHFAVLLPSGFYQAMDKKYAVRYNIGGYGSRYTRAGRLMSSSSFKDWWMSDESPDIINVFLDGEGPYGDCYQMNSDNSGPYGEVLIQEIIPYVEENFRARSNPDYRFLDGCSTGGWVSLALQLFYPETFNGTFSYSPDPVTFDHMQLIDLYEDENAFYNASGYERPSMRNTWGDPVFSIKKEIQFENVLAKTGTFNTSRGQWGAWNALYSPKGENGYPVMIFDPFTGEIDKNVAKSWEKYDLKKHLERNWSELGPKLEGKIWVWMGDMDEFYLNNALRSFDQFIQNSTNPKSDAVIKFSPMQGHCDQFNHRQVLEMMAGKMK